LSDRTWQAVYIQVGSGHGALPGFNAVAQGHSAAARHRPSIADFFFGPATPAGGNNAQDNNDSKSVHV
jgi:hypothetical protein